LAHFHLAECYFELKNRVAAVNEYRAALNCESKTFVDRSLVAHQHWQGI